MASKCASSSKGMASICLLCCRTRYFDLEQGLKRGGTALRLLFDYLQLKTEIAPDSVANCFNCGYILKEFENVHKKRKGRETEVERCAKVIAKVVLNASVVSTRKDPWKKFCEELDRSCKGKLGTRLDQLRSAIHVQCK